MIRKSKLLICMLFMSMVLTVVPGVKSYAEEASGGDSTASTGLQDENSQRLEEVTAMDEDGTIYEIGESDGTVAGDDTAGISMFSARTVSPKVVNFNTKGNAVTNYQDETNGINGYTNGAYGADAAYLGTTSDGRIRFMLSGVTGSVSASEVQVLDYSSVADNVSYYIVSGGKLFHYISQDLNRAPSSALNNGTAPSYLSEGVKYYSYDGHYFYIDYETLSSDYQYGAVGQNAVNAGNPFYNYFQFLDMRSSTCYSGDQLNSILATAMANAGIGSSSKLTGTGTYFVKYQDMYGVNALVSMGVAVNESGWGTSWICVNKNNIFGLNAVDSSAAESADVFASIEDCIREYMSVWMADGYLSSNDWRNHGEYLGNKGGGINVSYASDPYWGEKAAAIAWNLDTVGGSCDYLGTGSSDTDTSVPDADTGTPDTDTGTPDTDTGTPDTDTSVPDTDTGTPDTDTGTPDTDTGTPDTDAGVPDTDTGTPDTDAGVPDTDTGTPDTDAGVPDTDTGTPDTDAGVPDTDTGTPDTDAGVPDTDTGTPDTDAGVPDTDTSVPDSSVTDESNTENKEPEQNNSQNSQDSQASGAAQSTLTDKTTGISINGTVSSDAVLSVESIQPNTDNYANLVSAEDVKGKTILGVYEISVSGEIDGKIQLTFQVGTEYNGKKLIILHYKEDGTYETFRGTVDNGQITISVDSFSPFVIALDDSTSSVQNTASPKTGDTGMFTVWAALSAASVLIVLAMVFVVLKKRRY